VRRERVAIVTAALAWALGGCAQPASPDAPPIASLHRAQCGKCHRPPEPGSHSKAQLDDAFTRHQKRVRLTPDEWTAITNYLAAPDGSTAPQKD
jgi:hypothetical protein